MKTLFFYVMHIISMLRCKKVMREAFDVNFKYEAAICAIAKWENEYLAEWIEHHIKIGFQHIFLVDNNDDDSIESLLKVYLQKGVLTIIPFRGIPHVQAQAYEYVTQFYGDNVKWMAYIDIDEFFVLKKNKSIIDLLKEYEDIPSISVNWMCYGANGQIYKKEGSVMARFSVPSNLEKSKRANFAVKSISRPYIFNRIYDASFRNVHRWSLPTFNEKREIIYQNTHKPSYTKIVLNHYVTKSYEEYRQKRNRGSAMFVGNYHYDYDVFFANANDESMKNEIEQYEKMIR